jgi:hypothetical protein
VAGTKNRVLEMDIPETGKCNLAKEIYSQVSKADIRVWQHPYDL